MNGWHSWKRASACSQFSQDEKKKQIKVDVEQHFSVNFSAVGYEKFACRVELSLPEAEHVALLRGHTTIDTACFKQSQSTDLISARHYWFDLIKLFSPFGVDYDIVYHNFFMGEHILSLSHFS